MNETSAPTLMQKKIDDFTLGDSLKVNAVILAALLAIPVVTYGVTAGVERIVNFRKNRKSKKFELVPLAK